MSELDRWDYNKREVMYNDSQFLDHSGWKPANPVVIFSTIRYLIKENEKLRKLLRESKGDQECPGPGKCNDPGCPAFYAHESSAEGEQE